MFLSVIDIKGAIDEIIATIINSLGPITNLSSAEAWQRAGADFGIQIVSTVLLFVVVAIFFWKPITKILEKRREAIDKELEDAQTAKSSAVETELSLQSELKEAKETVKEMLSNAEREANLKREEIIKKAKEDAEKRMQSLEEELQLEKKNMEDEIRKEIVDVAFKAAEKIVSREIDQEKYNDIVDEILKGALE